MENNTTMEFDCPIFYESRKQLFQYLPLKLRKTIRENCFKLEQKVEKRTMDDILPYNFKKLTIQETYTDSMLITAVGSDGDLTLFTWEFSGNTILVKTCNPEGAVLAEKSYESNSTPEESVKCWIEFYLDRKGTYISDANIQYFPGQVVLNQLIHVKNLDLNVNILDDAEISILKVLKKPICSFYSNCFKEHYKLYRPIVDAKKIKFFASTFQNLEEMHFPSADSVTFKFYMDDVSSIEIVNYLKVLFSGIQPRNANIMIEHSDVSILEETMGLLRNDTDPEWKNTYLHSRECVSLKRDGKEVNIYIKHNKLHISTMEIGSATLIPPALKPMLFKNALMIFERLSYSMRMKIDKETNVFSNCNFPFRANYLTLICRNGTAAEATLDGSKIEYCPPLVYCLGRGSFLKNLRIQGVWSDIKYNPKVRVENLILESELPFPQKFFEIFEGNYPSTLTATCEETVKYGAEMVGNVRVVQYTNQMEEKNRGAIRKTNEVG